MEAETSRSLQAVKTDTSSKPPRQAALCRLPFEIRRSIYRYALLHTVYPDPKEIYLAEESITSLPPASLYFVNRQIHSELRVAFAKPNIPLILHVTPQGTLCSGFSETHILAGRPRDITRALRIQICIWPPHPDRPAEIFDLWRSVRNIQRQLLQAAPLQRFGLEFFNNEFASWCPNGRILDTIRSTDCLDEEYRVIGYNDMTEITGVFCRVRTLSAGALFPPEVKMSDEFPETSSEISFIFSMMKGKNAVPNIYHKEVTSADKQRYDNDSYLQTQELRLQAQGAKVIIGRFIEKTFNGQEKLLSRLKSEYIYQ